VNSHPGIGSTFKVYLPRVDDLVEPVPVGQAGAGAQSDCGSETLLLVEDEDALRALICQVLAKKGYNVLAAENPDHALAISAAHPGPIHILVTDVVLRQANGHEMARRLIASRPATRVLFMSGYTPDAMVRQGVASGAPFLQKPFTNPGLIRKVREVLDMPVSQFNALVSFRE
jgi:DNA-binding response OmpR family regulator